MGRGGLLVLGARIGVARTAEGAIRFAAVVIAVALSFGVLATLCTIPGALEARTDRAWSRGWSTTGADDPGIVVSERDTTIAGRDVNVLALVPPSGDVRRPPGLSAFPDVGEAVVSPGLRRLIDAERGDVGAPELGRVVGEIGAAGLVDDRELFAYVGIPAAAVAGLDTATTPAVARAEFVPAAEARDDTSAAWVWVLGAIVLLAVPMAGLLFGAVRLGEQTQRRQLAALRLVGASVGQLRWVRLGSLLPAGAAGLVIGAVAHRWLARRAATVGIGGRTWYPDDVRPTQAAVIAGLALLLVVLVAGQRVVGEVLDAAWTGRRGRVTLAHGRVRIAIAVVGIVPLAVMAILGGDRLRLDVVEIGPIRALVHVLGLGIVLLGAFAAGPVVIRLAGDALGRRASHVAPQVAGRLAAADPVSLGRWSALLLATALLGGLGASFGETVAAGARLWDVAPPRRRGGGRHHPTGGARRARAAGRRRGPGARLARRAGPEHAPRPEPAGPRARAPGRVRGHRAGVCPRRGVRARGGHLQPVLRGRGAPVGGGGGPEHQRPARHP